MVADDGVGAVHAASMADGIRARDPAAEAEFARFFGRRIFIMALARTQDPDAASDLAQDTLLTALEALRQGHLREPDKLPAFVCGTARNLINNYLRARSQSPDCVALSDDTPASITDEVEEADRLALVRRALGQLESADRQILEMTLAKGWTPAEIAENLGLSAEVVRQRKHRALERAIEVVKRLSRPRH